MAATRVSDGFHGMKLGAIHHTQPPAVRSLASRAGLQLMSVPASADWFAACPADGDALGNDRLSDCVPVAMLRALQVRRANAWGDAWRPDLAMAVGLYSRLTGFDPATGCPDDGTDTVLAMSAWASEGIATDQALDIVRWAKVNPLAIRHLQLAIAHTGPVQATLALPVAAQDIEVWSLEPKTGPGWERGGWGAHRVVLGAYDSDAFVCRTWGRDVRLHPAFWRAYGISVDATLSRQWMDAAGVSPAGLDWDGLAQDMAALGAVA